MTAAVDTASGNAPTAASATTRAVPTSSAVRKMCISARGSCGKIVLIAIVRTGSSGCAANEALRRSCSPRYSSSSVWPQRMQKRMLGTLLPHWLQVMNSDSPGIGARL
jgi:hypothetical protein